MDSKLKVELVSSLPDFPTNMAFIGSDDILVLTKNDGQVLRIKDGNNLGAVLKVNVTGKDEMGLLGIATEAYKNQNQNQNSSNVFLYYSLCSSEGQCDNFDNGTADRVYGETYIVADEMYNNTAVWMGVWKAIRHDPPVGDGKMAIKQYDC